MLVRLPFWITLADPIAGSSVLEYHERPGIATTPMSLNSLFTRLYHHPMISY